MLAKLKQELEKKHYKIYNHSGVQICEWTKKSLRREGFCYKEKFYGVDCHRCMQFSPSVVFCDLRCLFCWCPNELFMSKIPEKVDEPEEIVEKLIGLRKKLLSGFGGSTKEKDRFKESLDPNHFAISLSGEPTLYPKIKELVAHSTKRARTVFLVTNGTNPEKLKKIEPAKNLQVYISLTAPDEEKFKKICRPVGRELWSKFLESLEIMSKFNGRRVLRITLIRDLNDSEGDLKNFLKLIEKENPDFVEVKSYMSLGYSKKRLGDERMPSFEEVKKFALKIADRSNYRFEDECMRSRIVLLKNRESKVVSRFE